MISLNMQSTRIQTALEKAAGKLSTKISKAKSGAERKKIKGGKTRVTLQTSDIVDVATAEAKLEETVVHDNLNMYMHIECGNVCTHLGDTDSSKLDGRIRG